MATGQRKIKSEIGLKEEVRAALLGILRDAAAPATARASAAKTLYEMERDEKAMPGNDGQSAAELTADELDAEIARLSKP